MIQASIVAKKPTTIVCSRKIMASGAYKKTAVSIGLDSIYIYRSEETTKLSSSLILKSIMEMEVILEEEGMPLPFGVKVVYGTDQEHAIFAFTTKEEAEKWMDELNWRVQATHRVFKYDDASSEDESVSTGQNASRRRRKEKSSKDKSNKFSLTKKNRNKK